MNEQTPFSIRSFLRERQALLVHFNTPMSHNHSAGFPDDLRHAKVLDGKPLSFSTIQRNDRGPRQGGDPAAANAGGSVGMIVDIQDDASVQTVDPNDSGSSWELGSAGKLPGAHTCAESLDLRTSSNEWWVQNYDPIGIFVFLPAAVFVKGAGERGERAADLNEILTAFPEDRVFSVNNGYFLEYIRDARGWVRVSYGDIVPAEPRCLPLTR